MPMTSLAGSRLRDRRQTLGLRQAEVAEAAGISASYLNLIEHNRRRVTGDVLVRLAGALGLAPEALAEGAEVALAEDLRAVAAMAGAEGGMPAELDRLEEFVGRFPGWAGLLSGLHRRVGGLERAVAALNDRIAHDPHLSASLHELLSAISSVRSTAEILAETEDIEPEWRARFHANLHDDSERLAAGAEALVAWLDRSGQAGSETPASPQEEFDAWMVARGWHLAEVEAGDGADVSGLASGAARDLAVAWAEQAGADARALPLEPFRAALAEERGDPARLARRFGCGVLAVMRRIATLPGSAAGLVICDASGTLTFRKPAEGFVPPRFGAACALWPLYGALSRPGLPVEMWIETAGRSGRRFHTRAWAETRFSAGWDGAEVVTAAMLVLPDEAMPGASPPRRVGSTCRICPEARCPARRETSILAEAG